MIPLEFTPILIASHRQQLHELSDPHALPDLSLSRRERDGAQIDRLSHWVADYCLELTTEPTTGSQPGLSRA